MKRRYMRGAVQLAVIAAGLLAPVRGADGKAGDKPLTVRYLSNKIVITAENYFIIRSSFEVSSPGNRWIALDMEFRLSQAVPLVRKDGEVFLKRWNNLFTPVSAEPVRWTDCRLDVDFADLESTENLPRDKRFVVWGIAVIWDYETRRHVGSGWAVRAPLLITTDKLGKITKIEAPKLQPLMVKSVQPGSKGIEVRKATLNVKHLKVFEGVKSYRAYARNGGAVNILASQDKQVWSPSSFGYCFRKIDTPEQAEELVCMQHPRGVLIKTRGQYDAILQAVRKLGWKDAQDLPAGPSTFAPVVTAVEGLGHHVQLLMIETSDGTMGDVAHWEYFVSTDGRLGATRTVCIRGPKYGDDKKLKTPAGPKKYVQAIKAVLTKEGVQTLPEYIRPTGEIVKISIPGDVDARNYLGPKDFPSGAKPAPPKPATKPAPTPAKPATQKPAQKKSQPPKAEPKKPAPGKPEPATNPATKKPGEPEKKPTTNPKK